MEKYIARNIDSLHRIDRGVTPIHPLPSPDNKELVCGGCGGGRASVLFML
jgi:hypothetical protein